MNGDKKNQFTEWRGSTRGGILNHPNFTIPHMHINRLQTFLGAAFFLGAGFFALSESLYEAFTWIRRPSATPFLSAARRLWFANFKVLLLASMYFLIADDEDPVLSLSALMAAIAMSRYVMLNGRELGGTLEVVMARIV